MSVPGDEQGGARAWLVAVALSASFCFTGLFNHPLLAAAETRVAGIAWEMAQTGDFAVPHLSGEPFLEKPPLYFAAAAGAIWLFGASEGVVRLPAALAALPTLLLAFDLARMIAGPRAGCIALLVLASTICFFRFSHSAMVDSTLSLFVTLGYWAYARALRSGVREGGAGGRPGAALIFLLYVAAALAFLSKGPIGVVLLAGPIAFDALFFGRFWMLRSPAHVLGAFVLLAGIAIWPALLYLRGGQPLFDDFFLQNVVWRIFPADPDYIGGHQQSSPLFYLTRLPKQVGVWLLALPGVAWWLVRGRAPEDWNRSVLVFAALVFPVGLALLSIPGTKRSLYLLPLLAPMAVVIAAWTEASRHRVPLQRLAWGAFVLALVANFAVRPSIGEGRDLGPLSREIAALEPVASYRLSLEMQGALPFYTGIILPDVKSPASLRAVLRELPMGILLQGDQVVPGFPEDFPELEEVARFETAEGAYRLYALRSQTADDS